MPGFPVRHPRAWADPFSLIKCRSFRSRCSLVDQAQTLLLQHSRSCEMFYTAPRNAIVILSAESWTSDVQAPLLHVFLRSRFNTWRRVIDRGHASDSTRTNQLYGDSLAQNMICLNGCATRKWNEDYLRRSCPLSRCNSSHHL